MSASKIEELQKRILKLEKELELAQNNKNELSLIDDNSQFELTDLVSLETLQKIQDGFAESYNIPSIIYGPDGSPITEPSCFTEFCKFVRSTDKGNKNCEKFDAELMKILSKDRQPYIRKGCALQNIITGTVPIIVEGRHLANFGIGQLIEKDFDFAEIKRYAEEIEVERDELLKKAKTLIPVTDKDFKAAVNFINTLAEHIGYLAEQKIRQSRLINERVKSEQALKENEEKYRLLTEAIKDVVVQISPVGKLLYVSPSVTEFGGYIPEEEIGKHISNYFTKKSDLLRALKLIADVVISKKSGMFEFEFKPKNRAPFTVEHTYVPLIKSGKVYAIQMVLRDITERKKAEKAFQESQQRFFAFANNLHGVAFIKDTDLKYIFINKNFEDTFGVNLENWKGKTDHEIGFYQKEVCDDLSKNDNYVIQRKRALNIIEKVPIADEMHYWMVIKFPLLNDEDSVMAVAGIAIDITEQKRQEQEIRKLSQVVETANQSVVISDVEGNMVYVNQALLNTGGFDNDKELIGKSIFLFSDDAGVKQLQQEIIPTILKEGKYKGELIFKRKDKSYYPVNINCSLITDETGKHEYFVAIFEDISERKNQEKEISRLATVINESGQTIVITDLEGNIEYVNPAFEKTTGYSSAEAIGQNPRILKSGEQDGDFYKELWDTITSGKTWQGIFTNQKKDGTFYYERAVIFPIKNKQNETTNYAAVKQDITNEKILEQQLRQSQKMESIGTLAGGVAHDFNNLLTVINGYAEMALMNLDSGNPLHKDMTSILSAGKRAENLTRQLLAFSRKQIFKTEIVDINLIISSLDKMLRRLIGEDIQVETILVDNLPNIKADKSQLEQIFVNLVVNARDAFRTVKKMDLQKKITIETGIGDLDKDYVSKHPGSQAGRHIFFAVSDNGCGMDKETKQRIFEPFFTTKEKGKGTGLGLSTVYGIVKQNKGSVYVYSEPGSGTTFKIYWPATEEKNTTKKIEAADTELRGSENILIVEDEKEVCRFAADSLMSLGYNVYKANNGRLALALIETEHPKLDMIITDLIMPQLNGKEFIKKAGKIYPDVKVIYVSGYTDNHIVHDGMLEEGVNFIHKPYSVIKLASAIRKVLDEK